MVMSDRPPRGAAIPLQRGVRYLTPTSRLATWLGASAGSGGGPEFSTFAYVPRRGEPETMDERFFLSAANYGLLTAVG